MSGLLQSTETRSQCDFKNCVDSRGGSLIRHEITSCIKQYNGAQHLYLCNIVRVNFFFLFMLLLVDYQNLSLNRSQLDKYTLEWKILNSLEYCQCFAFLYLPYRSECVGKPCEMVTWPNVCYDVILKVIPYLTW